MKKTVQTIVSEKLIELIEKSAEWKRPFKLSGQKSATSGSIYKGVNQFMLSLESACKGYNSDQWITPAQIKANGGCILKGERSSIIVYYLITYKRGAGKAMSENDFIRVHGEKPTRHEIAYCAPRFYKVFNLEQVANLPEKLIDVQDETNQHEVIESAEDFINGLGAQIQMQPGQACYYPSLDKVCLPPMNDFISNESYYSVAFHELVHWTGHPDRLNRDLHNMFGSPDYAKEELVAETGAAFLCAEFGIESTIENSAAYLKSWLKALKNDVNFVLKAMTQSQKAVDYLLETAKKEAPVLA